MWLDGYIDWFVVLIVVWLASVGGVIGSFLNVVIYRLPLDMSLVRPGSRCSVCLTPIRWYDNLPVLGWLWLRGKCRACGSAISARYPAVEAIVMAFFVALFASEFCCGGAREAWSAAQSGFHAPLASDLSATDVWMRYWLQVLLGVTLLAAGLMEFDDRAVPRRLFTPTLLAALAVPFIWRGARPLPFEQGFLSQSSLAPSWAQPMDLLLGLWTGLLLAILTWRLVAADAQGRRASVFVLASLGLTLGWQLTAVIGASWLATLLVGRSRRRTLLTLTAIAGTTLLVWRPFLTLTAMLDH